MQRFLFFLSVFCAFSVSISISAECLPVHLEKIPMYMPGLSSSCTRESSSVNIFVEDSFLVISSPKPSSLPVCLSILSESDIIFYEHLNIVNHYKICLSSLSQKSKYNINLICDNVLYSGELDIQRSNINERNNARSVMPNNSYLLDCFYYDCINLCYDFFSQFNCTEEIPEDIELWDEFFLRVDSVFNSYFYCNLLNSDLDLWDEWQYFCDANPEFDLDLNNMPSSVESLSIELQAIVRLYKAIYLILTSTSTKIAFHENGQVVSYMDVSECVLYENFDVDGELYNPYSYTLCFVDKNRILSQRNGDLIAIDMYVSFGNLEDFENYFLVNPSLEDTSLCQAEYEESINEINTRYEQEKQILSQRSDLTKLRRIIEMAILTSRINSEIEYAQTVYIQCVVRASLD